MVLRLRIPAPGNWHGAKCHIVQVTSDYDPWFDEDEPEEAKDFCNGISDGEMCKIREACLIFALTNNEKRGVWGGTDPATRRIIRKLWPLRRGKKPRPEWRWMDAREAAALLSAEEHAALAAEPDEDDEEEEEWVA